MVRNNDDKTKDRTILGKDVVSRDILLAAMKQIDTELGALLVQLYQSSVTVDNAEKNPVNVKELGTLTADDVAYPWIITIYDHAPPVYVPMEPEDLMLMFDKDPSTYYELLAPDPDADEVAKIMLLYLKTPFDIKRLKFTDPDGQYITFGEDAYVIVFTPDVQQEGISQSTQPIVVDDEVNRIMIINEGTSPLYIAEITGTIYHPVEVFPQDPEGLPIKSPPEHQPINVQEMPELVPESIRSVEIYPYAEMVGFVERRIPTVEEHIGFVQKELITVEEYVGFVEKGYFERFIGYSEKPKTVGERFVGFSEKPTTVMPRMMGYSEKPTTVRPRYVGYSEKPKTVLPHYLWYTEDLYYPEYLWYTEDKYVPT
jgi:hypothetical protein